MQNTSTGDEQFQPQRLAISYDLRKFIDEAPLLELLAEPVVRCYCVRFRNGAQRWVVPSGKKDEEIGLILDEPGGDGAAKDLAPLPSGPCEPRRKHYKM